MKKINMDMSRYTERASENKISNDRQYWIKMFITKLEEQKKIENLHRFWRWKGKMIPPKMIKPSEMIQFKEAKLPNDRKYLEKWTDKRYATHIAPIKTENLQRFYDECRNADDSKNGYNFTVHFFSTLKKLRTVDK